MSDPPKSPPATPDLPAPLGSLIVVLDEPQNIVNIAGVVRAMNNMGVRHLRLVRPAEFNAWRIEGIAHRSRNIVENVVMFDSLADAVADATFVVGTSARARTAQRNYARPREIASHIASRPEKGPVAILFGREDRGLSNEALDLCQAVAIIPTDAEFSSLNLAQACLILLYEVFLAARDGDEALPRGRRSIGPAAGSDLEEMYGALEAGLDRIEFFKARQPEAVLRTLRTMLSRADLDLHEARLIRAIGFEIGHYIDRTMVQSRPFDPVQQSDDNTD